MHSGMSIIVDKSYYTIVMVWYDKYKIVVELFMILIFEWGFILFNNAIRWKIWLIIK